MEPPTWIPRLWVPDSRLALISARSDQYSPRYGLLKTQKCQKRPKKKFPCGAIRCCFVAPQNHPTPFLIKAASIAARDSIPDSLLVLISAQSDQYCPRYGFCEIPLFRFLADFWSLFSRVAMSSPIRSLTVGTRSPRPTFNLRYKRYSFCTLLVRRTSKSNTSGVERKFFNQPARVPNNRPKRPPSAGPRATSRPKKVNFSKTQNRKKVKSQKSKCEKNMIFELFPKIILALDSMSDDECGQRSFLGIRPKLPILENFEHTGSKGGNFCLKSTKIWVSTRFHES